MKTDVQDITDGLSTILALHPKTYQYNVSQFPSIRLPDGGQSGLLAQDVEEVLPHLVKDASQPPVLDSLGNVVVDAVQFKAIRMEGVIPYLIDAVQQLKEQNDALQAQIDGCCVNQQRSQRDAGGVGEEVPGLMEERLLITPNPFTDHTTLKYFVVRPGKVSLQVSDDTGRPISTLREEQAMSGAFTYEWDTQSLSQGTYFVSLLVDGNVVVKKAVKVGAR